LSVKHAVTLALPMADGNVMVTETFPYISVVPATV